MEHQEKVRARRADWRKLCFGLAVFAALGGCENPWVKSLTEPLYKEDPEITEEERKNYEDFGAGTIPGGNIRSVSSSADWTAALASINSPGDYIINVTGNVSVPVGTTFSGSGITVSLRGGGTLACTGSGNLLNVGSNQHLIIRDVTLEGNSSNFNPLTTIWGKVTLKTGGKITGNNAGGANSCGMLINGGEFIMEGGEISGNYVGSGNGGGVRLMTGTFRMSGGIIRDNHCSGGNGRGGGVYINFGTFIKTGGIIYGGSAAPGDANTVDIWGTGHAVYSTYESGKYRNDDVTDDISVIPGSVPVHGGIWYP
ncbi:MAG: hypothetical protein LBC31_03570 [Treponema sp.]|jgi:hypothetical protein|nr:hypothetical protein [Treponema sp.]